MRQEVCSQSRSVRGRFANASTPANDEKSNRVRHVSSVQTREGLADGDHVVQFYDRDEDLLGVVGGYLAASLLEGDAVIVMAAPSHCDMFRGALVAAGVDVEAAEGVGALLFVDAAEIASRLMADGRLDVGVFDDVVAGPVRRAAMDGRPVRVYGEIVAVMWEVGDVAGAIELERLWNALGDQIPFALFCAYPSKLISGTDVAVSFAEVCRLHSQVVEAGLAPTMAEATQSFDWSLRGPRLARSFVTEVLQRWDRHDLVDDVAMVVSELATNAVVHAGSDFTVGLWRWDGRIRLEVIDSSSEAPQLQEPGVAATIKHGLYLVDAIALRWGHAVAPGGKVVWAEIGPPVPSGPGRQAVSNG